MYLKNLTLRGFKSFASTTALKFEPGITCVVGPNGSGKSNVVDALAWVMGEQGAKSLRGGKMEDVIFAGTADRPPLGRAEVVLTIDNSDGALPIDYTEVTISRLMFRAGHSEYAINGDQCRLLDVQELLSDSGIGREMHVIVGQGQLDTVLHAGPEERRALIEEAAGVLKHRKRKEKALRKIDAMEANLQRVQDLTAELRRQLKPLGRQAEVARKAAIIQADLRDARLRLLADDVVRLRGKLAKEEADEAAVRRRRGQIEAELTAVQEREAALERAGTEAAPRLRQAQETHFQLSALKERLAGVASLAAERHRNALEATDETRPGRDPEELEREAAEIRDKEIALREELEAAKELLAQAVQERSQAEERLRAEEERLGAAERAAADRREGLVRLRGEVAAAGSRAAAAEEEIGRLSTAVAEAAERAEIARAVAEDHDAPEIAPELETEQAAAEAALAAARDRVEELAAAVETPKSALANARSRVAAARNEDQRGRQELAALEARKEALELGLAGSGNAAERLAEREGVLGTVAQLITIRPGYEIAIGAALGAAAEAVAVRDLDAAVDALKLLRGEDAGRAGLLIAGGEPPVRRRGDLTWAIDVVSGPASMDWLLDGVVVVEDLAEARVLVAASPELRAVTRTGELLGAHWAEGGSPAGAQGVLEMRTALDETSGRLEDTVARVDAAAETLKTVLAAERAAQDAVESARSAADQAQSGVDHAQAVLDDVRSRCREAEAEAAREAGEAARLQAAARAAAEERDRLARAVTEAERGRERDLSELAELEARLAAAEEREPEPEIADDREALADRCTAARQAEMEARLSVRTVEERVSALAGKSETALRRASQEREARERLAMLRARRERQASVAASVMRGTEMALAALENSLALARTEREEAESTRSAVEEQLQEVRSQVRAHTTEMDKLVHAAHGSEVARAQDRLRLEQLEGRAAEEFGVEPGPLVEEYGPDVPVPIAEGAEPYDREIQEKRAATADRQLKQLGKVNPLALEEFAALEERHAFLSSQLEDLKNTRRDLMQVVKEVDDRVQQVFAAAFEDVAEEFARIFDRVFPGGEGRLVLTDPQDMLATGVEVEARPPGKKIKRLSLLSGGERSLTSVAFLIAIFKARPSPFYVMDEVEAALDDTNLQRLLALFEELRETSQLIVITHQKRTMEVADALYGVSMRGDGVTQVVSQRLHA